jgi:hypothetical protein
MKEIIRAVDAGMKEMDIILEINGKDVIVTTPYEKIAIPQKLKKLSRSNGQGRIGTNA